MTKKEKRTILFIAGITVLNAVIFPLINAGIVYHCIFPTWFIN